MFQMFPIFMGVILLIMLLLVECLRVLMHEAKYLFIWTDKYWFKLSLHWLVNFTGLSYVLFTDAWVSMSAYIWIHCVFICILAKYHVHMHRDQSIRDIVFKFDIVMIHCIIALIEITSFMINDSKSHCPTKCTLILRSISVFLPRNHNTYIITIFDHASSVQLISIFTINTIYAWTSEL